MALDNTTAISSFCLCLLLRTHPISYPLIWSHRPYCSLNIPHIFKFQALAFALPSVYMPLLQKSIWLLYFFSSLCSTVRSPWYLYNCNLCTSPFTISLPGFIFLHSTYRHLMNVITYSFHLFLPSFPHERFLRAETCPCFFPSTNPRVVPGTE